MRNFNFEGLINQVMTKEIVNLALSIRELKGAQSLFIESKADILDSMLEIAQIQSTGASNRIEGIFTSEERLIELVKEKTEPKNRSEKEIVGYREVLELIHENYESIPVTPEVVLKLHKELFSFSPNSHGGKWKNTDNVIQEIDSKGNKSVRFRPTPAFETPRAMQELCDKFNEAIACGENDPLFLIPIFILNFLCIHPFNDGNGRMSRLLTLLLLYRSGYIVGKYISIEMLIEKTKNSYYDSLKKSSTMWHEEKNTFIPFTQYYLSIIFKAYSEFSSRVEYVSKSKYSKSDRIRKIFNDSLKKLSKKDLTLLFPDISISTIENTLLLLQKENFIEKIGTGRSTAYIKIHR